MISITGVGITCNLGNKTKDIVEKLTKFSPDVRDKHIRFPAHYDGKLRTDLCRVAEVQDSNKELFEQLEVKCKRLSDISRSELMAIYAIKEATAAKLQKYPSDRVGLFCGTSQAGTTQLEKFYTQYKDCKKRLNLRLLLCGAYNAPNQTIAKHFKLSGPTECISTACSSSNIALYIAYTYMLTNQIDAAIVYGVDPISELVIGGFKSLQAMAANFSTPFSDSNVGMSLGEGAAAVFLEKSSESALAYINDIGCSSDAFHITAPDPNGVGARLAMAQAFGDMSNKCDVVYAHGSGTTSNDECESRAIQKYFGKESVYDIPVLSVKGAIGHTLGAAGLMNVVLATHSIRNGIIPKTPGFQSIRSECDVINIVDNNIRGNVDVAVVSAFGFGGNNSSVLLCKQSSKAKDYTTSLPYVNITSFGFITPVGSSIEDLYKHVFFNDKILINGTPTCSFSGRFWSLGSSNIDAMIPKVNKKLRKLKNYRKLDRFSKLVMYSAMEALGNSQYKKNRSFKEQLPIIFGTGTGPMESIHKFYDGIIEEGIECGNPGLFPNNVMNGCLGYLSIEDAIKGPSILCADYELSSANAIKNAWILLGQPNKKYSSVLAGGADEYSTILDKGYLDLLEIKTKNRDGYILSEIGASFLFETQDKFNPAFSKSYAKYMGSFGIYLGNKVQLSRLCTAFYTKIVELIDVNGNPDLILIGTKNKSQSCNAIINVLKNLLPDVQHYLPLDKFGYQQGSVTALNFLLAIMFFEYQRLPLDSSARPNSINTIYVITITKEMEIVIDVLKR